MLVFVVPPGAIVCGHIALGQIRRTGEQGHGLALAGALLGYVLTGLVVLFVLIWITLAVTMFSTVLGVFGAIQASTAP